MSVISKAASVIRVLEAMGPCGATMGQITDETGLPRPTAYRLLDQLSEENITLNKSGRWYARNQLSPHLAEDEFGIVDKYARELAHVTGVTAYVAQLDSGRALYVTRADGTSPIRVFSVRVGESKRLATSYAGVALLSRLPRRRQEAEIEHVASHIPTRWMVNGAQARRKLWDCLNQTLEQGWCGTEVFIPQVAGLAAPVPNTELSLTISGVLSDIPPETHPRLAPELLRICADLGQELNELRAARTPST
ncbi:IclR family transcriptional regulator [Corynebacterium aquilae]|uniref:IclR-ED domain-containing protein n=1 Tax=Corynebacterium aquilae DSM 44791 TaxID=1431546 RepID=A0A1L7CHE1_9CORY|nr:helix-turn-helix domain-containing protein [Corynebacterium aquilae]APT85258.1 hypothetical protein CAQU_09460 [Corynebacterium aquilae DSM 44791]